MNILVVQNMDIVPNILRRLFIFKEVIRDIIHVVIKKP